jgi:transposase-like protein
MATKAPRTLQQAILYYADERRCHDDLVAARWPDGVVCPTCGRDDVSYLASQKRFQCKTKHPKRQFSAKVGSIFEDSALPLSTWFACLWLIANAKNGISSYEVKRSLGVTQKSAWFMLHRIRLAMKSGSFENKLSGEVEIDETYVGGKVKNMHASKRKIRAAGRWAGKVAVMGLLERHGANGSTVRTQVVPNVKRTELTPIIAEHVEDGSQVFTDALQSYKRLGTRFEHDFIDHTEGYVRGSVHTNSLESFWSMLKRTLGGTYISVEAVHLPAYLDEQSYRFNTRKQSDSERFRDTLTRVAGKRLTYAELTDTERKTA